MAALGIEEAARASGLSARDLREMIERGTLPATRPAGRWLVNRGDLSAASMRHVPEVAAGPAPAPAGPIGAAPGAPVIELQQPPAEEPAPVDEPPPEVETDGLSQLLGRLEGAALEIADLRTQRDDLKMQLREQVSSLKQSLEDALGELDGARARVAELEANRYEQSLREEGLGARAALTPLFRATEPRRRNQ